MGLFSQVKRSIARKLRRLLKRGKDSDEIQLHKSWIKPQKKSKKKKKKKTVVIKHKRRIPFLKTFNRILAGLLLLINFIFSQFLLGFTGGEAQPLFLLFLANCYVIIKYLWGSRRREE